MSDTSNTIAAILFDGDSKSLADLAKAQADWRAFYKKHGEAMLVDVDYLEEIGGPGRIEMILHIGTLHNFVFNADWREDPDEFVSGIQGLKKYGNRSVDWDDFLEDADDLTTNDFMHGLAQRIDTERESLVIVDIGSDTYDFAIVERALIEKLGAAIHDTNEAQLHVVNTTEFRD